MPNISALELISRFIENENLRQMKKWSLRVRRDSSNRKPRILKKFIKKVKELLILVSGNDVTELLKDVLTERQRDELTLAKYKNALSNLTKFYEQTPLKERHYIMRPMRNAKLNFKQVKRLGFPIGRHLWKTCLNPIPRNLGGGSTIPDYLKNAITSFLKERSTFAANRLVRIRDKKSVNYKQVTAVRYLEDRKSELFKSFPYKNDLSKRTFCRYANVTGVFKKPFRFTDLCEYCEDGRVLKRKIDDVLKDELNEFEETYNFEFLIKTFETKIRELQVEIDMTTDENRLELMRAKFAKFKQLIDNLHDFDAITFHKNVVKAQRLAYNNQRKNVNELKDKLFIELDFKEKISIGVSPRQINKEYYSQQLRSLLGFGIYYVTEDGKIDLINFDIISSVTTQDGLAAVRGFRILREQEFFKKIDKKDYIVWADCGKHFRCNKFVGYLLKDLANEQVHVNLNFFCDKHGKNSRDAHFSNISRFIKDESLVTKLESSQDVVNAILKRQRISNENKNNLEKRKVVQTYALELDEPTILLQNSKEIQTLSIKNLESFYNYRTVGDNFDLVTSILSNHDDTIKLEIRKEGSINHQNYVVLKETFVQLAATNKKNLHLKKTRISTAINKSKLLNEQNNQTCKLVDFFPPSDYK